MPVLDVVILAAGLGSRLGLRNPKPLTPLADGRSILRQQLDKIESVFGPRARITVVVGFKYHLIMEEAPHAGFVYNEEFHVTNTNRSLLKALRRGGDAPTLWMNGDVVFDPALLSRMGRYADAGLTALAVNTAAVGDEEVKYTVAASGRIQRLSKAVPVEVATGEAVGVNVVSAADTVTLVRRLSECDPQDYFERGIELAIDNDDLAVWPVDVSDLYAIEVDTADDLALARVAAVAGQQAAAADAARRAYPAHTAR